MRREGSPFTGLGPVFMKELSDHLSSTRMLVLTLFVIVFGAFPVASSLQALRTVVSQDAFLFLRIFTIEPEQVPISFITALNFILPLMAIGLGFDSINGEYNRRTMSRILAQPIYRDALLFGGDPFFVVADFASYVECQMRVDRLFSQPDEWRRHAILNIAGMGGFSIDRTVTDYARLVWGVTPTSR